jgi:hypothetical protein
MTLEYYAIYTNQGFTDKNVVLKLKYKLIDEGVAYNDICNGFQSPRILVA